jgi:hypothetical protein
VPLDGVSQGGRYYVLEVGDRGEVGAWRRDDDHWVDLVPWTRSEVVHPGAAPNDLQVIVQGPQLRFLVNNSEVFNVSDGALKQGGVGLFVGGDLNEVVGERFSVSRLR